MNILLSELRERYPVHFVEAYQKVRWRIWFHAKYTFILGLMYQALQYSIPVLSVIAGFFASSQETEFLGLTSKNIILISSFAIAVLGSLNSTIKPAQRYVWTVKYVSKFEEFLYHFDLEIQKIMLKKIGNIEHDEREIIEYLQAENAKITRVIDEFNRPSEN